MAEFCSSAIAALSDGELADVKARLEKELADLLPAHTITGPTLEELSHVVLDAWDDDSPRIPYGIGKSNEYGQQMIRGELHVIGASPSVGKTAFLTQSALVVAHSGFKAMFVSYEMDAASIWRRMVSQETGLPMYVVQDCPTRAQGVVISQAMQDLRTLKLAIRKPQTSDVNALCAMIDAERPDVVYVDYMQLVRGEGDNRVQQVGNVAQALKNVAMRVPCVVVVASQLSRAAFAEKGDRPELHHLRESGEIEAVADVIMLLWRDKVEQMDGPHAMRYMRVAKNRNGPVWEQRIRFDLRCAKWDDNTGEETL